MSLFTKVDDEKNGVEGSEKGDSEKEELVSENKEKYEVVEFNDWEDMNLKKESKYYIYEH